MTVEPFVRLVSPGTTPYGRLFVEIAWNGRRLSITGVEGPKRNGDCRGSCGQCVDALGRVHTFDEGWCSWTAGQLRETWERWHLNDMRAGTPAQEAWIREHRDEFPGYPTSFYEWASYQLALVGANPDDSEPARDGTNTGYHYGSAWLHEDVPEDVLRWLHELPETTYVYPWKRRRVEVAP